MAIERAHSSHGQDRERRNADGVGRRQIRPLDLRLRRTVQGSPRSGRDKWTLQVVVALRDRPQRFNDIKRHVAGISQQMLTRTPKTVERDGPARHRGRTMR
jgi:DNA-binding HxlR family transcriptional regulator